MRVRNINGTSADNCPCGSWLEHWKKFSRQTSTYCPVDMCTEKTEAGAHVQKDGSHDERWFIIPLCKQHNAETGKTLTINSTVTLVPAIVSTTCGR